jgi:IS4 transposase
VFQDRWEGAAATALVTPGQVYLFDSGVVSFGYLRSIRDAPSDFLCALAEHVKFQVQETRTLSAQDRAAGVLADTLGHLPGSRNYLAPTGLLREVRVAYVDRQGKAKILRLLTSLLDLPAYLIAELYRYRWQIELFFRWLKASANFEHLTSHSKNGVSLAFHLAVIACLLTSLHTQQGLSKYSHVMLGLVAAGQAQLQDVLPIIQRREGERQRERARQLAKRAAKKAGI